MVVDTDDTTYDFTAFLPVTLSEDIFTQLDVCSLCSASEVSRRWYAIINDSEYIWRYVYKTMEMHLNDCDRDTNLSYKNLVAKAHAMLRNKSSWLNGDFSFVSSFYEIEKMQSRCIFSKNDWGEIFQRELDR